MTTEGNPMHAALASTMPDWMMAHDPFTIAGLPPVEGEHVVLGLHVEVHWLPIIGPSALWMLRRFCFWVASGQEAVVDHEGLGRQLGLTSQKGRNSPVVRTVARLVRFGVADCRDDKLFVRQSLSCPRSNLTFRHLQLADQGPS